MAEKADVCYVPKPAWWVSKQAWKVECNWCVILFCNFFFAKKRTTIFFHFLAERTQKFEFSLCSPPSPAVRNLEKLLLKAGWWFIHWYVLYQTFLHHNNSIEQFSKHVTVYNSWTQDPKIHTQESDSKQWMTQEKHQQQVMTWPFSTLFIWSLLSFIWRMTTFF